jgi:hypothetical protein
MKSHPPPEGACCGWTPMYIVVNRWQCRTARKYSIMSNVDCLGHYQILNLATSPVMGSTFQSCRARGRGTLSILQGCMCRSCLPVRRHARRILFISVPVFGPTSFGCQRWKSCGVCWGASATCRSGMISPSQSGSSLIDRTPEHHYCADKLP